MSSPAERAVRAICFFGLSGVGKSTLMAALCRRFPDEFVMTPRYSTRPPKAGDRPGEILHITEAALRALEARGELTPIMKQNARAPSTSLSAYAWTALEGARIPLLACSVFSREELQRLPGMVTVHITSDWSEGLARRGGKEQEQRRALNSALADLFTPEALGAHVDVVFEHRFEDAERDADRLFTRLCEAIARRWPAPKPGPLANAGLFVTAANVRVPWRELGEPLTFAPGVGQQGDLVLGELHASPARPARVYTQTGTTHELTAPARVLAVLGNRESSTHVNGGVPPEGLPIAAGGAEMAWLAGESGLAGRVFAETSGANPGAEQPLPFRALGLVCRGGVPLNVAALHRAPAGTALRVPVIGVAATSAEAGKTTLCEKLIRALSERGRKVGAVKATGTGGTVDSRRHRAAGAIIATDQVDGGLISTYVPEALFRAHALNPLLLAQQAGAEVLVVELGGDIPSANNPALLQLLEEAGALRHLLVLCNDSLAALGAWTWLRASVPGLDAGRLSLVASPFRNVRGFEQRAARMGLPPPLDPNAVEPILRRVLDALTPSPAPAASDAPVDAAAGRAGVLAAFWRRHAGPRELLIMPASERMDYELDSPATAIGVPEQVPLEGALRALHALVGNAAVEEHHLVLGVGSRQLVIAALYAAWRRAGQPLRVQACAPFYPFHGRLAGMAPGIATWDGVPFEGDGNPRRAEGAPDAGPAFELISSPANPTGEWLHDGAPAGDCLLDLAYHWPHLAPRGALPLAARRDALMTFSLSKLSGHAASRVGWAWVKDAEFARTMRHFIRHDTIGPSGEALARAELLVRALLRDSGALYRTLVEEVTHTTSVRWARLLPVLKSAGLECRSRTDGWCYAFLAVTPEQEARLHRAGIRGYPGARMGAPGTLRLNLLLEEAAFDALLSRLEGLSA
jgi:L-tryptophan--pyruvate aminotransferase